MSRPRPETPQIREPGVPPERSPEGVDLTLIRWMLSMSPEERLNALQNTARSLHELRHGVRSS